MSITIQINEDAELVHLVCRYMKRKKMSFEFVGANYDEETKKWMRGEK